MNCVANDSLLLTPAVTGAHTNFTQGRGTLRLWFAPAWSSTSVGGKGPGEWATLFELEQTNAVKNPFGLVVSIDPSGTNLVAAVHPDQESVTLVALPIAWTAGEWHQVAFVYWAQGVVLAVDDDPEQFASTVPRWPGNSVWNQSAFSLGSGYDGQHQAQGQLDEIHTFSSPLSSEYLTGFFQFVAPIAALGPLPEEKSGGAQAAMGVPSSCDLCPSGGGGNTNDLVGGWTTNAGLKFIATPLVVQGTNFFARLTETSPGKAYEIYQTLNLQTPSQLGHLRLHGGSRAQPLRLQARSQPLADAPVGFGCAVWRGRQDCHGPLFTVGDPPIEQMIVHPPFPRMFWRTIYEAVAGPFRLATINPVLDANYALINANYTVTTTNAAALLSPDGTNSSVSALCQWIANRYNFLTQQLATVAAPFEISNNDGTNLTVNSASIQLPGKAPVEVAFIRVNAASTNALVTWTSVNDWSLSRTLTNGINPLTVQAYDRKTNLLSGLSDSITITKQP